MAFYPSWQATTDPSQSWQNQFIQQIPQQTPTITPLNTIEFQPQTYAYPANGYVQTGIGFDPNYGRTYAAPAAVQRYEFQTTANQLNQVSLQNVSFASTVTYAGQVSAGPSPVILTSTHNPGLMQSNGGLHTTDGSGGLNGLGEKATNSITMGAGNEMPGYPRVNSVPPHSLSYNGYSGDLSGKLTTTASTTASSTNTSSAGDYHSHNNNGSGMHPPPFGHNVVVVQSPGHQNIESSPGSHLSRANSISSQQQSPNPEWSDWTNGGSTSTGSQQQQQHGNGSDGDMFGPSTDRVNLNTRLKTMILNKGGGSGSGGGYQDETSSNSSSGTAGQQQQQQQHHHSDGNSFSIIKNVC